MIWKGKSPFTVGICDELGNVIEKFTAQPGQLIPEKWMKIIRAEQGEPLIVDDKGHYDPKLVRIAMMKDNARK